MKPLTQAEYDQLCAICGEAVSLVDRAIRTAAAAGTDARQARATRDHLVAELLHLQSSVRVEGQDEPEAPRLRLVHDAAHVHARAANQAGDGPCDPDVGGDYSSEEGA